MLFWVTLKAYWNASNALDAPNNVALKEPMAAILRTRCARGYAAARGRRPCIRGVRAAAAPANGGRKARLAPTGPRPGECRRPERRPGRANLGWPAQPRAGCRETTPDNPAPRETGRRTRRDCRRAAAPARPARRRCAPEPLPAGPADRVRAYSQALAMALAICCAAGW